MTEQLSIIDLVLNASPMVQAVMALLMVGSVVSWVMIFQKGFMLSAVRRESTEFENEFWSGNDLQELYMSIDGAEEAPIGMKSIFVAGFKEFSRLRRDESDLDRIMQNVQRAMRVSLFREEERLETNLTFLATVGSISPYIGFFGTVWGIMYAFMGLSTVNQVSLSVVAGPISDALIATAMGLFAAIPAVIAYNRYSAQLESVVNRFDAFSDEFSGILSRAIHARERKAKA